MRDVIVGTAGHIDHGKSALVKALTGTDPDRLEEEKRRGITIDIGFAHFELGPYRVGFIDVPGHERFVKNMLAGVGGIDVALLVVAATESVMPQTVEHFEICRLLDIRHGLVAITKRDEVEQGILDIVRDDIRRLARHSFFERAPVVAVDSLSGTGIEDLKQALLGVLAKTDAESKDEESRVFVLPVDRVFTIKGFGTVVTGTAAQGRLEKDATLAAYPAGLTCKVRGIQVFNQSVETAHAGQRTALNLSGVDKGDLERGMVLAPPLVFEPSSVFDVFLTLLESCPRSLQDRAPVRFHHGSAELLGRVYLLEGSELPPGTTAPVQIRLDSPTICFPKDRFVIRSYSPMATIGGGVILDNAPARRSGRHRADASVALDALGRLANAADPASARPRFDDAIVEYFVARAGSEGVSIPALVSRTGRREQALLKYARSSSSLEVIADEPALVVSKPALGELAEKIARCVSDFQTTNPLSAGVSREELKNRLTPRSSQACFQRLLELLEGQRRIQIVGGNVGVFGARAELSVEQEQIKQAIVAQIRQASYQPPAFDDLARNMPYSQLKVRDVYHFLIKRGELVRINSDIVLLPEQVAWLKEQVRSRFRKGDAFGVPEFKDIVAVSRKFAIPYLEYLDRERVTRRAGDKRIVL